MALTSIFLKIFIDGKPIKGESQAKGYEGQIEVESFNWGVVNTVQEKEGSKVVDIESRLKHASFNKVYDASSGPLIKAATFAKGKTERLPMTTARFTVTSMVLSSGGARNLSKMFEMVLTGGYVEDVSLSASESKDAISIKEEVTLAYSKCKLMYYPLDIASGNRTAPMSFDIAAVDADGKPATSA